MNRAAGPVGFAAAVATTGAAIAAVNAATTPPLRPGPPVPDPVTVLVPARDEAATLPRLIADLRAQRGVPGLRVLILDDDSTDGTSAAAATAIGGDPRFTVHRPEGGPPPGWVGKPAACARLADLAAAADPGHARRPDEVLVFLDADVRLASDALAAAVRRLREMRVDLLCPWPSQLAVTPVERLLQPLLCWSWAASAPLPVANRSLRPSLAVACGQFLVCDATVYDAIGGHRAVAASVAEDLDLARALRRARRRTAVVPGGGLATCRMYTSGRQLRAGHGRWLWTAFGSPVGAALVLGVATVTYTAAPVAAITGPGRRWGLVAYGAAAASRLIARTLESGTRPTPAEGVDALVHPLSVLALAALTVDSHLRHRRGTLVWKGRPLRRG
ncbi:glycosyltransferase [Rhodococcus olei]|uniref:Glycosyltransferase n=1 Tax=Rhodococcus olei TaxID=2161675 RepID=A0ABP8P4S4_9NOCA